MVLLIGIAVVAVSLGVLFYLGGMLWGAVRVPVGGLLERQQFERHVAQAARGDRLLEEGALGAALAAFEAALHPHAPRSAAMAKAIARHHTGLLSRFIAAADQMQGERVRLLSLAKADRLFHERAALHQRYLTLQQGGARARVNELGQELRANTRELRATLSALTAEIASPRAVRYQ